MHMHWIIVLLCASYLLPGASGAPPVYVGNELKLREHYLANLGDEYVSYLHTDMLPHGSVTQFQMYIHDEFHLHDENYETRCIWIHLYENDPPNSPAYLIRWKQRVCASVNNRQLDIPVNPPITVQDDYYFGWTIDAHSEAPVTFDKIANGKTFYRLGLKPVDTASVYFHRINTVNHMWSIGVTVADLSDPVTPQQSVGMIAQDQETPSQTANLETTSSSTLVYVGNELKLRVQYLANTGDKYVYYLHTDMLPHGSVTQFQMYIHDEFHVHEEPEPRYIWIHLYENDPPNSPAYRIRWKQRVCASVNNRQLDIPVNPPITVQDNYYFGWTIDAHSEAPVTFSLFQSDKTLSKIGHEPIIDDQVLFSSFATVDQVWSIGVVVDGEAVPVTTPSIPTEPKSTSMTAPVYIYVGNDPDLRSDSFSNPGTNYVSYLHTDVLPYGEITTFQVYNHVAAVSQKRCMRIQVFENNPPGSAAYYLIWQHRECTDVAGRMRDVPVTPNVRVGDLYYRYYFGWTIEPMSEPQASYDHTWNGKTLTQTGPEPLLGARVDFPPTSTIAQTWSIGVILRQL